MARPKKQTKRQRETEANKAKAVLLDNMTLMFMNSVQKQSPVRGEKGKMSRVLKVAIFTILTSRVDEAGYLGQFHLLNTSEKSLGLDFKPLGKI
jgi:hypothetical protein